MVRMLAVQSEEFCAAACPRPPLVCPGAGRLGSSLAGRRCGRRVRDDQHPGPRDHLAGVNGRWLAARLRLRGSPTASACRRRCSVAALPGWMGTRVRQRGLARVPAPPPAVYPFQEPLSSGHLDFIEHIFGDVDMAGRETLVPIPGTGDELDGEGTASEMMVQLVSIRPQVLGGCAGVDPVLPEDQKNRAPAACYEARQ
jgi:hypothetical protein